MVRYEILIKIKNTQQNNLRQCHVLLRFPLFLAAFVGFTRGFLCLVVYSCFQWYGAFNRVGFAPLNCNQSHLILTLKLRFAVSTL